MCQELCLALEIQHQLRHLWIAGPEEDGAASQNAGFLAKVCPKCHGGLEEVTAGGGGRRMPQRGIEITSPGCE